MCALNSQGFIFPGLQSTVRRWCAKVFMRGVKDFWQTEYFKRHETALTQLHPRCLLQSATHAIKHLRGKEVAIPPGLLHKRYYYCPSIERHHIPYMLSVHSLAGQQNLR